MTKPLRIALIMQGDRGWIGGMEYIRNIIHALTSLGPEERSTFELCLLSTSTTDRDFIASVKPYLKKIYALDSTGSSTMRDRISGIIRRYFSDIPDYVFDPVLEKNSIDFAYPCMSHRGGFSSRHAAAWIYDFQHKYLPDLFSKEDIAWRDMDFAYTAEHASLVVLSSRAAEADFRKFFPRSSVKTAVLSFRTIVQPGWFEGDPIDIQHKYNLPDKFFIVSNQFWQHKNHLSVLHALRLLNKKNIHPAVVCTGHIHDHRKPEHSDLILQTLYTAGLANQVSLLGLVPKYDQIQLLRRSIALIQPSLFEGWSTVVEDARCMGKPAILSDIPVHLEQNPPSSRFFDRTSVDSLAQAMADYWETLTPGSLLDQEASARFAGKLEVVEFGRNFLTIARSFVADR